MEQGAWITATVKVEKKEKKVEKMTQANGFAALESDEEEVKDVKEEVKEPVWGKQKIDWAADSDDE
jgi:hypothetical protein